MIQNFEPPRCTACNVTRQLLSSEPIVRRYELRAYRCPNCKSLLQIVERSDPSMLPDRLLH